MSWLSKYKQLASKRNESPEINKEKEAKNYKGALLICAGNEIEAQIIESKLNVFGIPTLKEYVESGIYSTIITGRAVLGVNIYVPTKMLDDAKAIINVNVGESEGANEHGE
jgi:hypothetical protein